MNIHQASDRLGDVSFPSVFVLTLVKTAAQLRPLDFSLK